MKGFSRSIRVCLIVWSALSAGMAHAATELTELYQAERVIAENSREQDVLEAMSSGMAEVLVRMSGYSTVTSIGTIQEAMQKPRNYLLTFRYENSSETLVNALGEVVRTKKLVMEFDSQQLAQLLTENTQPIWGVLRPQVLVWLAYSQSGLRELVSEDSLLEVTGYLTDEAEKRGVPIMLPQMDLEDQLNINPLDIWGMFIDRIQQASERYQPEAVVSGRIQQTVSGEYRGDWIFLFSGEERRFSGLAETEQELIQQMVDQVAFRLANQYALVLDDFFQNQVQVRVSGIKDLQTYHRLQLYMSRLNGVNSLMVSAVEKDEVSLTLDVAGDLQQLKDIIALDRRLKPVEQILTAEQAALQGNEARYIWQP